MGRKKIKNPHLVRSGITLNLLLVIISSAAAFAILEITLRLFDPIGIKYFIEARRYFAAMQDNENYAYIHRPGYEDVLQGVKVRINSHGLRGPEFDSKKGPGITRIVILGDSLVFGWGVSQSAIFALQLQEMLAGLRKDIEVIPAGVGSWNTRNEYEFLKSSGLQWEPDIIVLLIASNDIEPKDFGHTDISRELLIRKGNSPSYEILTRVRRYLVYRSYLLSFMQYYLKRTLTLNRQAKAARNSPQWRDAELALNGIVEICRERRILFVPFLYGTYKTNHANPVMRLYSGYFKEKGIDYIYLPDDRIFRKQYRNSFVDRHPNDKGHTLLAERIYAHLKPLLPGIKSHNPAIGKTGDIIHDN